MNALELKNRLQAGDESLTNIERCIAHTAKTALLTANMALKEFESELEAKDTEIERKTKALAECLCMIADSGDMAFADRIASENFETWQEIRRLAGYEM